MKSTATHGRRQSKRKHASWRGFRRLLLTGSALLVEALALSGCYNTPIGTSEFARGPAPMRMPSPAKEAAACCYEDSLTGGQVFAMYCGYCHNAPALAERNFANFRNVAAHMRVRANLTGKEYAKLMEFLRRWNDIPPPTPPVEPSPKRFEYSQPIQELREQKEKAEKESAQAGEAPQWGPGQGDR